MKEFFCFVRFALGLIRDAHNKIVHQVWTLVDEYVEKRDIPLETLIASGEEMFQEFILENRMEESEALAAKANRILGQLLVAAQQLGHDLSGYHFKLAIAKKLPSQGQCYAGGQIVLDAAWVKYAPSSLLASLIAHEVSHALLGHGQIKRLVRGAAKATAKRYDPQVQRGVWWYLKEAVIYPFYRRCELDADLLGCRLMQQAGYPMSGMVWQNFISWLIEPAFFWPTTHPGDLTRIFTIIKSTLT